MDLAQMTLAENWKTRSESKSFSTAASTTNYTGFDTECPFNKALQTVEPTLALTNVPTTNPIAIPTFEPTDETNVPSNNPKRIPIPIQIPTYPSLFTNNWVYKCAN